MPKKLIKKTKKIKNKHKLPSVWLLLKTTSQECIKYWKSLLGIISIYAALQFVFVLGLSFSTTLDESIIVPSNRFNEAIATVFSSFGSSGFGSVSQSDATIFMQFLLFIIASMAFIWTLRKLQSLKSIKLRDAYYEGTSALIPTILITCIFVLTLLPAALGSGLLSVAVQAGGTGTEVLIFGGIAGLLLALSFYLFVVCWPSFYIISLPNTKPIQAIKLSIKTTRGYRFTIMRKLFLLALISFVALFVILLPVALVLPSIIPVVAFILLFIAFGFSHVYLYNLYRSLL